MGFMGFIPPEMLCVLTLAPPSTRDRRKGIQSITGFHDCHIEKKKKKHQKAFWRASAYKLCVQEIFILILQGGSSAAGEWLIEHRVTYRASIQPEQFLLAFGLLVYLFLTQ